MTQYRIDANDAMAINTALETYTNALRAIAELPEDSEARRIARRTLKRDP